MDRLNLYLDLEDGQLADLEVVARASLSFASAVREIAYIVDPSITIKLDLESGTEGSLSLNSVVRFLKEQVSDPVTRRVIIVAVTFWFIKEIGAAVLGVGVSSILAPDPRFSEEQENRIAEKVVELIERGVGQKPVQNVYRELSKDKSIKGVGVSTQKGDRPKSIVPREQFSERMGVPPEEPTDRQPRTRSESMFLMLISPVLQNNENKWRFLSKDGTIYASIKDEEFLSSVLSGRAKLPMQSGIIILADVEIVEKWNSKDKVWVITERRITKVRETRTDNGTRDLFAD